jgi:hypothetical protein
MKEKSNNFYKISTYVLLAILVVIGIGFIINSFTTGIYNNGVQDGRAETINIILSNVINSGSAEISIDANTSVILVPSQAIELAQQNVYEQTISQIAELAVTEGAVTITSNNQSLTLVPFTGAPNSNN